MTDEQRMMYIGKRIKRFRLLMGVQQKEFAKNADVSDVWLNRMENHGGISAYNKTMLRVADAFGIKIYELYLPDDIPHCTNCRHYGYSNGTFGCMNACAYRYDYNSRYKNPCKFFEQAEREHLRTKGV